MAKVSTAKDGIQSKICKDGRRRYSGDGGKTWRRSRRLALVDFNRPKPFPKKYWAVIGFQTETQKVVRYVGADTADWARDQAIQGTHIRESKPEGVDFVDGWMTDGLEDDVREVTEAEARGTDEPDAPKQFDPFWEMVAPTLEEPEPGYLLGHVSVLGQLCHVEFVRAKKNKEGCWQRVGGDAEDNDSRIEEILIQASESMPIGIALPDRKGMWLIRVGPYCD